MKHLILFALVGLLIASCAPAEIDMSPQQTSFEADEASIVVETFLVTACDHNSCDGEHLQIDPLAEIQVTITLVSVADESNGSGPETKLTGIDGKASFADVRYGEYTVEVTTGRETQTETVIVDADRRYMVRFRF